MTMKVLCGNCQTVFFSTVPDPLKDAPPPLASDRTQLSLTCNHCGTAMPLRIKTSDIAQAAAAASDF